MPQLNIKLKDYLNISHETKMDDGMLVRKINPDSSCEIDSGQWLLQRLNDLPVEASDLVAELSQLWSGTSRPLVHDVVAHPAQPGNHFLEEKYRTLFNIILTPDYVLQEIADKTIKNTELKQFVLSFLRNRIATLEQEALLIQAFREYVYKQNYTHLESLLQNIQRILHLDSDRAPLLMKLKLNKINSEEKIERYVLDSKKFSDTYKKTILNSIALNSIHRATTLDEVLELVKYFKSSPDYNMVKRRSRNFNLSFLGTQFGGADVSNTFSLLIKAAKKQMIKIATQHAEEGDISDLTTLASHGNEFCDFIHTQRFRFFREKTDSDKAVATALALFAAKGTELVDISPCR